MSPIITPRLVIRTLERKDAESIIRIRSIKEISKFQNWIPQAKKEIYNLIQRMENHEFLSPGIWFQCSIVSKSENRLIGDIGFSQSPENEGQVELGITIETSYQKQGIATEAIEALITQLFQQTTTRRIIASIDPNNSASLRLFEKLGFRKEAHHIESIYFKGKWVDDVIVAILEREWEAISRKISTNSKSRITDHD